MSARVKLVSYNDPVPVRRRFNVRRLWTLRDLTKVFHRSMQTILNWRAQNGGLPCIEIPGSLRPAVRYDPKEVLKWAKDNDKTVYQIIKHGR